MVQCGSPNYLFCFTRIAIQDNVELIRLKKLLRMKNSELAVTKAQFMGLQEVSPTTEAVPPSLPFCYLPFPFIVVCIILQHEMRAIRDCLHLCKHVSVIKGCLQFLFPAEEGGEGDDERTADPYPASPSLQQTIISPDWHQLSRSVL